jgi:hypothetical protein
MKKIAQGRERRRNRQLDAAQRQAESTAKHLAQSEKQLALYHQELKRTTGREMADKQQIIERATERVKRLSTRLLEDQNRLQQLKQGNYPL